MGRARSIWSTIFIPVESTGFVTHAPLREYNPDIHDLLNPLTDEGELLQDFGSALRKDTVVRGYAIPDRCVETSQIVVQNHDSEVGQSRTVRRWRGLGCFMRLIKSRCGRA